MKNKLRGGIEMLLGVLFYAAAQSDLAACATCFGQTDSPLGRGLNWGIFVLLAVVSSVLAGICSFFVFIARRAAKVETEQAKGSDSQDAEISPLKTV